MLETKRINAYGKRSTRIVYVSDDRVPHASPSKSHHISRENNNKTHSPLSTRTGRLVHKVHGLSTSPRGSPKSSSARNRATLKSGLGAVTPRRHPLVLKPVNVSDSPSIVFMGVRPMTSHAQVSRFEPFVDSEVILIEESAAESAGKHKAQALPNSSNEETQVVRPSRKRAQKRAIVITDDEDDEWEGLPILKRSLRGAPAAPIVISDDDDDDHPAIPPASKARAPRVSKPPPELQPLKLSTRRVQVEIPVAPKPPRIVVPDSGPPVARPRSPRRSQRKVLLPSQKQNKPPALSSESEAEPEAASLRKPKAKANPTRSGLSTKRTTSTQQYLAPLLAECEQVAPHCFTAFIDTFPFDNIHGRSASAGLAFRKIGEASYSEVFAIGKVVLKIVPLRNESVAEIAVDPDLDMPQESDSKDVLQEVVVTRAMGQICPGFVKLLRTYVVSGAYPSLLLSLWDSFNDAKRSENIRPNIFPPTQAYALIVLPHGGPDLEAYTLPVKTGWRQACSIFWQTAKALATAEDLVSFEHRDLHWGQILVENTTRKVTPRTLARRRDVDEGAIPMDDPSHGVTATIIDLGLARMDARDRGENEVRWMPFDDLIFEGEGDYQFDVYRMMRRLHGDTWDQYRPLTNVMWLHYLVSKLLHAKQLRPPGKRSVAVDGEFSEKQCYECLLDIEQRLGDCLSRTKGKKARGSVRGIMICKAGDVVDFAKGRGWVQ